MNNHEQENLNTLINLLRCRLRSAGKTKSADGYGNTVYIDCDIYSVDLLEKFIHLSISDFNQIPMFTFFSLKDDKFVELFSEVLVEGATLYALSSQALIERGREYSYNSNGLSLTIPNIADMLQTQYATLLLLHFEKLKLIKQYVIQF